MEIALAIVDEEVTWETILLCNDDKVIELVSNAVVDAILVSDIWFVSLFVSKVTVDTTLVSDKIVDTMLVSMVTLPVVAKVSTLSPTQWKRSMGYSHCKLTAIHTKTYNSSISCNNNTY